MSRFCGRLTPLPGAPDFVSDAIQQSTLAYSPLDGGTVPIFDGTGMVDTSFLSGPTDATGLQLPLGSLAAGTVQDVFVTQNNGFPVLGTAPWSGTLAAPPSTLRIYGVEVNAASLSLQTASGGIVVPGYQATRLGTIQITSVTGAITCRWSYGPGEWGLFNLHRQREIKLVVGDNTWHWESQYWPTWRIPFNNPATKGQLVFGQPTPVDVLYLQDAWLQISTGYSAQFFASIGWNNNTAPDADAFWAAGDFEGATVSFFGGGWRYPATLIKAAAFGANTVYPLCKTQGVTGANAPNTSSCIFVAAQQANMQMLVRWQG